MTMSAPLPAAPHALRRALMIGCAIGAVCLGAGQASAQAFNGDPTTIAGLVAYDRATPGVETVRVDTNTAIILWVPNVGGNPIPFLPAGNTATFINGPNNTDFVVLNRIIADPAIRFDGTVLSQIQNAALGTSRTGGTVIFSSPGGIIVGAQAVFDVGSLVLTSLNVVDDGTGNFYDPATRGLNFAPFLGFPGGAVLTEPGAQIRALEQSSFVAMVAPTIQHGGSVRVNGSAAYVAGETVQLRVNQGLFDIIVDVGSDNPFPLAHFGATGGPASTGAADPHAIYLVAMPKNQAITAILQGDIGFDPAADAAIENGVIVLSAGANVVGGVVDRYGHATGTPAADLQASFAIRGGIVRSDLIGVARTDIIAQPFGVQNITFQQDVSLFGTRRAHMVAGLAQTIDVLGNAIVSAAAFDSFNPAMFNLTGGDARITTTVDGIIRIRGTATVDASARGLVDPVGNAGSGTGGVAEVSATSGAIIVDGALTILATGEGGGDPAAPGPVGGDGTGGNASLVAVAGIVAANGGVAINADGTASASDGSGGVNGAAGRGGNVAIAANSGGILTLTGAVNASASGQGGAVQGGPGLVGGLGLGGAIAVRAQNGTIDFNGNAAFTAAGTGGAAPTGGRGQGGDLLIEVAGGSIDFFGTAAGAAGGLGGDATGAPGGTGGVGQGGTIQFLSRSAATVSRIGSGAISLAASGVGGQGGGAAAGLTGGTGGNGIGGAVTLLAESGNGRLFLGAVQVGANGTGGAGGKADNDVDGGRGGAGSGGIVLVGMEGGPASTTPTGIFTLPSLALSATGTGGAGGFGRGRGGNGTGGTAVLRATGAAVIVLGPVSLLADGNAGAGGDSPAAGFGAPGQATGGSLHVSAFRHAQSDIAGTLALSDVTGSANAAGTGTGNAAGQWHVRASDGNVSATNLTLTAIAAGGTAPGQAPTSTVEAVRAGLTLSGVSTLTADGEIQLYAIETGRVTGGRINLVSGQDVIVAHIAPDANAVTVDVTDFFIRARDDVSVNAGAVTRASNVTDIRAADLATIAGRVTGRQINIGSADLDLQATGAVGDAATALVVLEVAGGTTPPGVPALPTTLGGAAQGPGYTLTGAEAGRIRADTLRIVAPALSANPARAPDLVVRDLALNGGGAAAGIGRLEILTPGIARVEGNLLLAGARAQDGINFTATERLEVPTPAGSIRVRTANGAPGGTMRLASNNLWIASAAIIDALRANPNHAGRDDALLDNGGTEVPRGYVEANGVTLVSGGTLYVQNTGSIQQFTQDFAGITVGSGGLTVTAAAPNTNVTAFGRRLNPDGSFIVGDFFFLFQSTYNTAGGAGAPGSFTPVAALNTCIIATGQCPARPSAVPGGADATTGPFGDPIGGSNGVLSAAGAGGDDLIDSTFAAEPLIDEPVTSGGEAGLWDCDPDHDGDCDDD